MAKKMSKSDREIMVIKINRETWLLGLTNTARQWFKDVGYELPQTVRVSCGLPFGRAFGSKRAIGQCWSSECSTDGTTEIFVSPTIDSAAQVGATLVHELVHAVVGVKAGHGPVFRSCALAIGLQGQMTATEAGEQLAAKIQEYVLLAGDYPHASMDYSKRKKQGTRLVKSVCKCGYCVRITRKWIEDAGHPICPACDVQMHEAGQEGEDTGETLAAAAAKPAPSAPEAPKPELKAPTTRPVELLLRYGNGTQRFIVESCDGKWYFGLRVTQNHIINGNAETRPSKIKINDDRIIETYQKSPPRELTSDELLDRDMRKQFGSAW
jgi:hypothetical protein